MLDDAEKELCQAKDQMNCCKCGGAGCEECQGPPGNGLGRGKGIGARPEKKTDTAMYDSQVKQKIGKGTAIVVGIDRRAERQGGRSAADSGAGRIGQARHDRSLNRPSHAPQARRTREGVLRRAQGELKIVDCPQSTIAINDSSIPRHSSRNGEGIEAHHGA